MSTSLPVSNPHLWSDLVLAATASPSTVDLHSQHSHHPVIPPGSATGCCPAQASLPFGTAQAPVSAFKNLQC